jgi:hypothetical protein
MSVLLGVMAGRCSTHPATAASSVLRRIGSVTLTAKPTGPIIAGDMSDHAFQALMLWLICAQVFMSFVALLVFWYKTRKGLDQIEGISAAVYLEVKRTLREYRSNP